MKKYACAVCGGEIPTGSYAIYLPKLKKLMHDGWYPSKGIDCMFKVKPQDLDGYKRVELRPSGIKVIKFPSEPTDW